MSKPQQDVIAALRIENEELKAAMRKAASDLKTSRPRSVLQVMDANDRASKILQAALKEKP